MDITTVCRYIKAGWKLRKKKIGLKEYAYLQSGKSYKYAGAWKKEYEQLILRRLPPPPIEERMKYAIESRQTLPQTQKDTQKPSFLIEDLKALEDLVDTLSEKSPFPSPFLILPKLSELLELWLE